MENFLFHRLTCFSFFFSGVCVNWGAGSCQVDPFEVKKDIEDTMVCILEYRNGVKATFHTNACSPFQRRRMCLYGLTGAVEVRVPFF